MPARPASLHQTTVATAGLAALALVCEALRRIGDLKTYAVETIALGLTAGVIYLLALFLLERTADRRSAFWLIVVGGILCRALLLPLPPSLSDDVHRYRWDGRVQQAGLNPYLVRPADPPLRALAEEFRVRGEAISGPDVPTIYPPLFELLARVTYKLLPGPVAFKLPFALADLALLALLAGWVSSTGGRNFQLAVYAWNPLVLVECAASGHNDAPPMLAVVAAAMLIIRGRWVLSTLLLAAGVLLKAFPVLLLPLWLRRAGWPRERRGWLAGGAALALAAVCAWPYISAWPEILDVAAELSARWRHNNASLYSVVSWFAGELPADGAHELAMGLGVGVLAGLALWVAARRRDAIRAAFLLFGATLLLSQNAFPWYFTWMVPLLVFIPHPAWLLLTVLQLLSYHVLIGYQAFGIWHFRTDLLWLTYGPFYAWLLWDALRKPAPGREREHMPMQPGRDPAPWPPDAELL